MMEPHEVILKPMVTEKSTNVMNWNNQYTFMINPRANKVDVRQAVEAKWNVNVTDVQIVNCKGKPRRIRWNRWGRQPDMKKAIIKLKPDESIDIF